MAEWLRRQPAKLMGFARVGSNPTVVAFFCVLVSSSQMAERMLSMHEAQGSIPCSSTFDFFVPRLLFITELDLHNITTEQKILAPPLLGLLVNQVYLLL